MNASVSTVLERRPIAVILFLFGLALMAACGGSGESPAPTAAGETSQGPSESQGQTSTVEGVKVIDVLTAFVEPRFTPDPIVLKVGEPVQFRVISADTRHTFTVDELNVDLQIAQKLLGGTAISEVITPQTAGTFGLYCRIHKSVSYGLMSGVIQVVD